LLNKESDKSATFDDKRVVSKVPALSSEEKFASSFLHRVNIKTAQNIKQVFVFKT